MTLKSLQERPDLNPGKRTRRKTQHFMELLQALGKKDLPDSVTEALNLKIDALNTMQGSEKAYRKAVVSTEYNTLKFLEKEHKIVPKHHYRKTWLALGMVVFGMPIGIAAGTALGNMGFIGAGIAIGLAIGIGIGTEMDKKAREEGRQLDFETRI